MFELPSLRNESRYGMPATDQILFNRHYVLGYSYHFRQAKWALEIVDPDKTDVERADSFRPDYRIPEIFRADLADKSSALSIGELEVLYTIKLKQKAQPSEIANYLLKERAIISRRVRSLNEKSLIHYH